MCYTIRCGGTLEGASVIAVSAEDALRQSGELEAIGASAVAYYKGEDEVLISRFELTLFASPRPIRFGARRAA